MKSLKTIVNEKEKSDQIKETIRNVRSTDELRENGENA